MVWPGWQALIHGVEAARLPRVLVNMCLYILLLTNVVFCIVIVVYPMIIPLYSWRNHLVLFVGPSDRSDLALWPGRQAFVHKAEAIRIPQACVNSCMHMLRTYLGQCHVSIK